MAAAFLAASALACRPAHSPATSEIQTQSATATATPSATPSPAPKLTQAQREFADAFISAANTKNGAAMRRLVAPEALASYRKETEPYFDRWLNSRFRYAIPAEAAVSFRTFAGVLPGWRTFTTPAQPTDVMTIEFMKGKVHEKLEEFLRQEKGKYYLIAPYPTAKGWERFKEARDRKEDRIREAREAYAKLQDPLRSRLKTLLDQHKDRDALVLCVHELNLEPRTARYVLDLLAGREPGKGFAEWPRPSAAPTSSRQ
jgi:hypothetical protein